MITTEYKRTHTFDLCQTHSYGISAYTVEMRAVWKTVHILLNVHAGRGIEFLLQMMYLTCMSYTHTHTAHIQTCKHFPGQSVHENVWLPKMSLPDL